MNPLSKLYKIATERLTRPDPLENVAHISTARFSQSWDAHGYHNVLAAAGYPVGRVQRDDRTATLKASWYFQHRHEDGDALAVVSHLVGKHGPVDREWLARQWPEAYRRINAVMSK